MDSAAIEARLKAFFEEDPRGAVGVYLFGSVARGEGLSLNSILGTRLRNSTDWTSAGAF